MIGPVLLALGLGIAGWLTGEWAGAVVGVGVAILVTIAAAAGALWWAREIGALLEPEDALAHAPRPPGFRRVCDWVYKRVVDS